MEDFEIRIIANEMTSNIIGLGSQQGDFIAIYVSVVFAFIAATYVAGQDLNRVQVAVATTLFCLVCLWLVYRITMLGIGINFMLEINQENFISELRQGREGYRDALEGNVRVLFTASVWSLGMIGALVFLWDMRRDNERG